MRTHVCTNPHLIYFGCPSVRKSLHLSVRPFVCLFAPLSIHLSVHVSVCLSVHSSVCPSGCLSVHLSVHPSVCFCYLKVFVYLLKGHNCGCIHPNFVAVCSYGHIAVASLSLNLHSALLWRTVLYNPNEHQSDFY